ncbi:MAG TPA: hypothetical protein VIJ55_14125, partial [Acetobacteraceae bacterium]
PGVVFVGAAHRDLNIQTRLSENRESRQTAPVGREERRQDAPEIDPGRFLGEIGAQFRPQIRQLRLCREMRELRIDPYDHRLKTAENSPDIADVLLDTADSRLQAGAIGAAIQASFDRRDSYGVIAHYTFRAIISPVGSSSLKQR